jgi:undecaprenyl-diphosphatase
MDIIEAAVLGLIQGLTEFLPVSSSGHLELAKFFFGDQSLAEESLMMTVVLHFATALSTMIVFRKDIVLIFKGLFKTGMNEEKRFALLIIVSMIPAALAGVFLEAQIESLFRQLVVFVALMLIVTGVLLFFADRAKDTNRAVSWKSALLIGIAQAIAILPGISRSGATISTSVLLGIDRVKAARFSFLMVVPLIFGKIIMDLLSGDLQSNSANFSSLGIGFLTAFVTGFIACKWMIVLVKKSKLTYFSIYCFVIAGAVLIYYYSIGL